MITGEIFISTTWNASTSFIPFDWGMRPAHDVHLGSRENRGSFATTAYVMGVWENQKYEEDFTSFLGDSNSGNRPLAYQAQFESMRGMGGPYADAGNAFEPGTVIEVEVRKIKALKASPNRSGVQVNRRMLKGNKLVFKYLAQGELVRP